MSRSLACCAFAALTLAACQSARPSPLFLQDTFPISYSGRIKPAEPLPAGTGLQSEEPSTTSAVAAARPVALRAVVVELPAVDLGVPLSWLRAEECHGAHIPSDDLAAHLADWRQRGLVIAEPLLATGLGGEVTFRNVGRRAFVSHLDVQLGTDCMLFDPAIAVYEHGLELTLRPRRDGDVTTLAFEWRSRDRMPDSVGQFLGGRALGSIQLPMTFDQRVHGEAAVVPGAAMLLGTMIGNDIDRVRLLCVEVAEPNAVAASSAH